MTDGRPMSQDVHDVGGNEPPTSPPSSAEVRAARFNAANMVRSLLPLVVICLVIVAWTTWRQSGDEAIHTVDPSTTIQLAAARASYPVLAPADLPDGYRVTSARTDAGNATDGDPVTLEIGYLTPSEEYAGFVVSDDPESGEVDEIVSHAEDDGTAKIGGETWQRLTTSRGETAFVRQVGDVTVAVTGSAQDDELQAVAAAVEPYSP
jgi:hypothetical protein